MEFFDLGIFRVLMDQVMDYVFLFDTESLLFNYVNNAAINQLGYSQTEFLAMHPFNITPEYDADSYRNLVLPLVNEARHELRFDSRQRRKDGTEMPVHVFLKLIMAGDGQKYFVAIVRDAGPLQNREDEIRALRQLLRDVTWHNERIRDDERKNISRELHDELGQYLTVLRNDVSFFGLKYGAEKPDMESHIVSMKATIDHIIAVVRNTARSSLLPQDSGLSLVAAIEWLFDSFLRPQGLSCILKFNNVHDEPLPAEIANAVFRVLQESFTNIVRHSGANNVEVLIEVDLQQVYISVEDDGTGFDGGVKSVRQSFGLTGMRDRLISLDGDMNIYTTPGHGAVIDFRIPLQGKAI